MKAIRVVGIIVLFGGTLIIAREPLLLAVGNWLLIQNTLQPADLIHVVSGADHRTDYAIQLVQEAYSKRIFFTGGWCLDIQGNHAERGRERALAQGLSDDAILTDGTEVTSTYAEVLRLKELVDREPGAIRSVIVVSDPHHMRRARWAYRRVLGRDVEIQMAPVPFEQTLFYRRWWTDSLSRQMVMREYAKIAYYYARYQWSWGPLQNWLASLDRE